MMSVCHVASILFLVLGCETATARFVDDDWSGGENLALNVAMRQYAIRDDIDATDMHVALDDSDATKIGKFFEEHSIYALHRIARKALAKKRLPNTHRRTFDIFMRFHDGRCMSQSMIKLVNGWAAASSDDHCVPASSSQHAAAQSAKKSSLIQDYADTSKHRTVFKPSKSLGEQHVEDEMSKHIESIDAKSVTKLDWPGFMRIMDAAKSFQGRGFKAREAAYHQEHSRQMNFIDRYGSAQKHSDEKAMQALVNDMVLFLGGAVTERDSLRNFSSYQTAAGSFTNLSTEILRIGNAGNKWIRFGGEYAPLNQVGYAALLRYSDSGVMAPFVTRVIDNLGFRITDNQAFEIFLKFYDQACGSHDYAFLVKELREASRLGVFCGGNWLVSRGPGGAPSE